MVICVYIRMRASWIPGRWMIAMSLSCRTRKKDWTIFSHHGIVLYHIILNPDLTILEIARSTRLSESWVRRIVSDLEEADMVLVVKRGVQNHYTVNPQARLRHPSQHHITIGDLVRGIAGPTSPGEGN